MFSNRRPYYGLKLSISDLFREPVRYLKQSNTQESMMEKPYLEEDYPKMHLRLPGAEFESYKRRKLRLSGTFGPIGGEAQNITYWNMSNKCGSISAFGRRGGGLGHIGSGFGGFVGYGFGLGCDDETDITFSAPSFSSDEDWIWNFSVYSSEVNTGNISLTPLNSNTVTLKITGDVDGELNICGEGTNIRTGAKLFCCHWVELNCVSDPCVGITLMTWDDDVSADTIARSDSVSVAVKDGLGPYNWSVSGTGFTLNNAQTVGVTNTLNANGAACGSATITVTDTCGSTTGYVRCTEGQWVLKSNDCVIGGTGDLTIVGLNFEVELIIGNKKQYIYYTNNQLTSEKDGDVGCVASIAEVCIGEQDCLTFTLPCFDIWGGSSYACSGLECVNSCTKLPYTETYRLTYVRYSPEKYYYEWEC